MCVAKCILYRVAEIDVGEKRDIIVTCVFVAGEGGAALTTEVTCGTVDAGESVYVLLSLCVGQLKYRRAVWGEGNIERVSLLEATAIGYSFFAKVGAFAVKQTEVETVIGIDAYPGVESDLLLNEGGGGIEEYRVVSALLPA